MSKLPALTGQDVISVLEKIDFTVVRQRGSHVRMEHPDGRAVTISVHAGKTIGKGLLHKILRDAELSREEFIALL